MKCGLCDSTIEHGHNQQRTPARPFLWVSNAAIPVYKNQLVPLTKTQDDGTVVDALCWKIGNAIHVHPDRWDQFLSMLGSRVRS